MAKEEHDMADSRQHAAVMGLVGRAYFLSEQVRD